MTGEWKAPSLNNIVYKHLQINWQNYLIKVDTLNIAIDNVYQQAYLYKRKIILEQWKNAKSQ